jgi:outer membrane protein TolC/ABC-type uncharacterized transport system substrate-binding protein
MASPPNSNPAPPAPCLRTGRTAWLAIGLLALLLTALPAAAAPIRIGIILDGPWTGNDPLLELFRTEITALTSDEFPVRFPADKKLIGDWTLAGVQRAADKLLQDPEVELILAVGVLTSHDLARRGPLAKPVIATFTVDRDIQGFPLRDGASGVRNFSYLAPPPPINRDVALFHELFPFRHLAVLVNQPYYEAIPEISDTLAKDLATRGIRAVTIPVGTSADEALQALPADIDAVYVTPLLQLPPAQFEELVKGLTEKGLPSFSYFGRGEVEQGLLAGAATSTDFPHLARRTALHLQRILLGEEAGSLPVLFSREEQLTINMATARAIGFSPGWDRLIEADLLAEEEVDARCCLSLESAMRQAATVNLELAAGARRVAAGEQEVRKRRAALWPQLGFSANGLLIDDDRAEASFGTQAEQTLSASLRLEQSLYSEERRANLAVERHRQEARLQEQTQLRLDIVQQAATDYLDVLRTKTLQTIQKNNLQVTRSNLALARMRRSVGFSGPSEVYRWESQLAQDRKAVIDADTRRTLAKMALNRILQRRAEEPFVTAEVGLDDPKLIFADPRLQPYLENPLVFTRFRDFMVAEGQTTVPELQRIDAAIAAAKRVRQAARRSFWVPELSFQASVTQLLDESGAGRETPLEGLSPIEFPEADDTNWSLGVNLTLPLYTGGSRRAELGRAREDLNRLNLERRDLADRIEQRIRSALHQARASHSGIRLSRQGAEAAGKNLELVTDSYSRGAVSIIELLDAQNASLTADQVAANAVYDFFVDLMEVQRAAGNFDIFLSTEEKDRWFGRLEEFWNRTAVEVP